MANSFRGRVRDGRGPKGHRSAFVRSIAPIAQPVVTTQSSPISGEIGGQVGQEVQVQIDQPRAITGIGDDLGANVQLPLKERIWRGEYVELGQLTTVGPSPVDQPLMLAVDTTGGGLHLRPQSRSPAIRSIEQWTSAMLVFTSIFAERHSTRTRELLKYVNVVRTAAECGYNWKEYDIQFRLRHARQPHASWAKVDTELWLLVATAQTHNFRPYGYGQAAARPATRGGWRPSSFRGGSSASAGRRRQPTSVCFAFNSGQCAYGKNCRYAHKCQRCNDTSHRASSCPKASASK